MNKRWVFQIAATISLAGLGPAGAADKPYDGMTLTGEAAPRIIRFD